METRTLIGPPNTIPCEWHVKSSAGLVYPIEYGLPACSQAEGVARFLADNGFVIAF